MRAAILGIMAPSLLLVACRTSDTIVRPDPHLERMLKQEKRLAYEDDPFLPHGMVMQPPPEGTLPVGTVVDQPLLTTGVAEGRWAERIPMHVDRAMIEAGRRRFEVFCAACHGALGDGTSIVADRMALRKPQNLLDPGVRAYPPGRVFQAIREGYGLMPSYAVQISADDAWGVVAYVRALQIARGTQVASLPPDVRAELLKQAPLGAGTPKDKSEADPFGAGAPKDKPGTAP